MKLVALGCIVQPDPSGQPVPLSTDPDLRLCNLELRAVKNFEDYGNTGNVYLGAHDMEPATGRGVYTVIEPCAVWRWSASALLGNAINVSELFIQCEDAEDGVVACGWKED